MSFKQVDEIFDFVQIAYEANQEKLS